MDRTPKPGEFYRHFKNKMYQIIAVAVHSETREKMVVYQALYGTFGTYVRPLSMFVSEVDHEKYPEVKQKYRFERITPEKMQGEGEEKESLPGTEEEPSEESVFQESLLAFLDAESYREKLAVLQEGRERFSPQELSAICEILETGRPEDSPEEHYNAALRYLETQIKFDGARLR